MVMLLLSTFINLKISRRKFEVRVDTFVDESRARCSLEYVHRFATAEMADTLSSSLNGQTSSNSSMSNTSSSQTHGSNTSNQTNKNESDDEGLSDFSEDETANMDLE